VKFTAEKFGGLIRLPGEHEDLRAIGQFLARYTARELAKPEDRNFPIWCCWPPLALLFLLLEQVMMGIKNPLAPSF